MELESTAAVAETDVTPELLAVLGGFDPVDLEQLDRAQLHDRVESKAILRTTDLPAALDALTAEYFILEHLGDRVQGYLNQYFDSAGLRSYHDHHNKLGRRVKVRYRTYENSALTFFELKRKVAGRTIKERRQSNPPAAELCRDDAQFFADSTGWDPASIRHSLTVRYRRILLVKRDFSERVTIDIDLSFRSSAEATAPVGLAICEFKQPRLNRRSPAMLAIRRRPQTFSKYCIGMAACDPTLRRNRFKEVFRTLDTLGVAPVRSAVTA